MKNNIRRFNNNGKPHGYWEWHENGNGRLCYKRYFINGKDNGYEEYYLPNQYELQLTFHL